MRLFPLRILQALAALFALGGVTFAAAAADADGEARLKLNVHVYGFSYHPDRDGVRRNGVNNEFNIGIGLNYTLREDEDAVSFLEAGVYRDSGKNLAKVAGLGYQFKFGKYWRLGGALVGVHSETYNEGRFFIAPLPIATVDLGPVKLNAIYVPRYRGYNEFAVFGFYFSLPLAW